MLSFWGSEADVTARNLTLGIFGGLVGASALIWTGYLVGDGTKTRLAPGAEPTASPSPAVSVPPIGASGNFNFNQSGGVVNQTYINQAPGKLEFSDALGTELLAKIPKGKPITVIVTGSRSDIQIGHQINNFLVANGYQTRFSIIGMMIPQPDRPITWDAATSELVVAPSVR
ncbi:hypothetical protein [Rhodopila globiformis]|uniref:hypothetical protein n=1 Tax=Rhodopila globiformis TaxID=1071 RepID=UPI0011B0D826|nr:hypothetical protein [Rhodopila globiformis]